VFVFPKNNKGVSYVVLKIGKRKPFGGTVKTIFTASLDNVAGLGTVSTYIAILTESLKRNISTIE
jgi:hypothetical protein